MVLTALGVPVMRLLDLPAEPAYQCCGTPFSVPHMGRGANANGTENPAYCKWCYDQGAFAYETMDDAIEGSAPTWWRPRAWAWTRRSRSWEALLPTLDHRRSGGNDRSQSGGPRGIFRAVRNLITAQ